MGKFFLSNKFAGVAVVAGLLIGSAVPASAVVNGQVATGSDYVVSLVDINDPKSSRCSGTYYQPRIVITAAHCVIKGGARAGEFAFGPGQLHVSETGADLSKPEARAAMVKVLKVWTTPEFFNRWEPEQGLMETQVDDIAFLFLEKELKGKHVDRPATKAEVEDFKAGRFTGFHAGYGCLGDKGGKLISSAGVPHKADGVTGTYRTANHIPNTDRYVINDSQPGQSVCPGDSGSGLLATINGETVYLATLFAAGGWEKILNGFPQTRGDSLATVLWPFLGYLNSEWGTFLIEEKKLIEQGLAADALIARNIVETRKAKLKAQKAGTLLQGPGCHANGINAEVQILKKGKWVRLAGAKGWDPVKNCPATNPVAPWTSAKVAAGSKLRWRYWAPGEWDVTGNVFTARKAKR